MKSQNGIEYINTNKQFRCENVWQVASTIAWLTNTKTCKDDWKDYCYQVKKDGTGTWDYVYHNNEDKEFDCSVSIGYDYNDKNYFVWVDC